MTIPATAPTFTQAIDPADAADFYVSVTRGDDAANLLRMGEQVANYTLALTAESVAAGLQLLTSQGYRTAFQNDLLSFWVAVDPSKRMSSVFTAGVTLGVELTLVTDNVPPRIRHRTIGVKVVAQ